MQRRKMVSNSRRSRSLSRKRPWRFFEKVEWSGTSPSSPMRAYAEETNRLSRERRANGEGYRSELTKIQRTLKQMLGVIEEGGHTRGMTDRMRELEAREDALKELLAQEPADVPDIHPNVSGICRKKVERLAKSLNNPEDRYEEAETIRALVEKITLLPGPNRGEIDATLHGELGTILGWIDAQALAKTQKRETPAASATGVSVSVVAGRANRFLRLIEGPVPKLAA
jgi:site-specific DNA recombinase